MILWSAVNVQDLFGSLICVLFTSAKLILDLYLFDEDLSNLASGTALGLLCLC
jgi:hypothetical protein